MATDSALETMTYLDLKYEWSKTIFGNNASTDIRLELAWFKYFIT